MNDHPARASGRRSYRRIPGWSRIGPSRPCACRYRPASIAVLRLLRRSHYLSPGPERGHRHSAPVGARPLPSSTTKTMRLRLQLILLRQGSFYASARKWYARIGPWIQLECSSDSFLFGWPPRRDIPFPNNSDEQYPSVTSSSRSFQTKVTGEHTVHRSLKEDVDQGRAIRPSTAPRPISVRKCPPGSFTSAIFA